MADFKVHFFKERSRQIEVEALMYYFKSKQYEVTMNEKYLKFTYDHPTIHSSFYFMLTPKSTVPDIYRLSPKYLDVNFEFNMPVMMSDFMLDFAFKAIESFTKYFQLAVYHPLFEDVIPFHYDTLHEVYKLYKNAFIKQNPSHLENYKLIDKHKLYAMCKYTDDMPALKSYFNDVETFVPKYQLLVCEDTLYIGFEWKDSILTVLPPECNVCFYRIEDTIKLIHMKDLEPILDKFFSKVPGTIQGTRVLVKKYAKKVSKYIKKLTALDMCQSPVKIALNTLMPKE